MRVERHDVIVIGSGFGGAVTAARLVESGVRVTLLERGPWRDTRAVRQAAIRDRAPLPTGSRFLTHALHRLSARTLPGGGLDLHRDGLYDIHYDRDLTLVCSSGVGGGSHVYSAMNVRPAAGYWEGHHDQVRDRTLAAHYDWILARMGSREPDPTTVPNALAGDPDRPGWMRTDNVPQPAMGFRFDHGRFANNSFFGSRDNSKVTLDESLLLPLLDRGLTVRDRHEVLDIARLRSGFRLTVRDHGGQRVRTLLADQVVLAAGTLNTLRLLFASRERGSLTGLPALGLGIGGNGDVPGYWHGDRAGHDFSTGTPCHGRFVLDEASLSSTPNSDTGAWLTRFGLNGLEGIPLPGILRRRLRQDLVLVGMGADQANGLACWHRGRLHITYSCTANPVLADIHRAFDRIGELSGRRVWFPRQRAITVHPLGGARLGPDSRTAVVDGHGQVHGLPGLFIADASALPASPGVPPSMTVAAWAGHVAEAFIAHIGRQAA